MNTMLFTRSVPTAAMKPTIVMDALTQGTTTSALRMALALSAAQEEIGSQTRLMVTCGIKCEIR